MPDSTAVKKTTYNIAARFFDAAERFANNPAVGFSGEDAHLTYAQLAEKVRECAHALGTVRPLEPIGLLAENRPEWSKAYFAILARGGTVVPIDPQLKQDELAWVISEAGIDRLLVSSKYIDVVQSVLRNLERTIEIIHLETVSSDSPERFRPTPADDPDSAAALIFTSGTTGKSKKVILTHRNIISDIDGFLERVTFGSGDRFLSVLPLHHTLEATCGFIAPLTSGAAVYYVKALNSREILDGIRKHSITIFVSVPLIYEKLYHGILNAVNNAPFHRRAMFKTLTATSKALYSAAGINAGRGLFSSLRKRAGLDSIRLMVSGGAPLPAEISENFSLMGFNFIEGYGLTETSPVLSVNLPDNVKHGSVGPPLPNVDMRIDRPDETGVGEIVVRGPMVTPGYMDNPEATAELIRDGWLYTGDYGRIDSDGFLFISGRKKNLIVSAAGKNIYPEEIEAQLLKSPFIYEAMAWGKKTESGREEVAALIYPDFEALSTRLNRTAEEIGDEDIRRVVDPEVRELGKKLADFKRVKHIEYTREELEKTSTKKIKRYKYQK